MFYYDCSEEEKEPEVSGEWSGKGGEAPDAQPDAEDDLSVVAVAQVAEQRREDHVEYDEDCLNVVIKIHELRIVHTI